MVDWDGARYADVSALQRMVAERAVRDITLRGDERLLDVGCGDGYITMLLAERVPRGSVVGIDASRRMIAQALTRVPPDLLRVQFHVDDVLALPFDRDFDIAVSFNALHWVLDQTAALHEIGRSLVDAGRAVIQIVGATDRVSIEDVAMEVATGSHWRPWFGDVSAPYCHPTPAALTRSARAAGFTVNDVRVEELQWQFATTGEFIDWFAVGATAWTSRLPDEHIRPFATDVVARYEAAVGDRGLLRFGQLRVDLTIDHRS